MGEFIRPGWNRLLRIGSPPNAACLPKCWSQPPWHSSNRIHPHHLPLSEMQVTYPTPTAPGGLQAASEWENDVRYRFQSSNTEYEVAIERHGSVYRASVDGQAFDLEILDQQTGQLSMIVAGRPATLYWAVESGQWWISLKGCTYLLEKPSRRPGGRSGDVTSSDQLRAPMPAQVRSVEVAEGDSVARGQTILLLEAMKMEIRLRSPRAARVSKILVKAGQPVEKDQVLVQIGDS